jgi:hypothetical protein
VDWSYSAWTQPECIYNPADYRADRFPILFFGFEVINRDCYEFVGNPRYEQAAAKAREFMAMTECYEIGLRPSTRRNEEEFFVPARERKPEKVEALRLGDDPTCHMHLNGDHNFSGAYYTLRSVLLDKTLQGYGGLFDERRKLDRVTPLMQAMHKAVSSIIGNESFRTAKAEDSQSTAPIFKLFLNPNASNFPVTDRLRALFNPAYCSEADKKDHWALYNRLGLMDLFADNLLKDSPEGKVLQEMFLANYDILHTDVGMPGLQPNSLDFHFNAKVYPGTVVCFCDPESTFLPGQGLRDPSWIAAFGDAFEELATDEKWRMHPGDKVWLDLKKVKSSPKLRGTFVLVEITDRNGGDGRFSFRCGDIEGNFVSDQRGGASVYVAKPDDLKNLQHWHHDRFRSIDEF